MSQERSPVAFVSHRWEHLSAHSGYDRLVDFLGGETIGDTILFPQGTTQKLRRWTRACFIGAGSLLCLQTPPDRYYTKRFRAQEREIIRAAARDPRPIYHFLYGESAFRRFKRARPRKKVVCTFHQPPSILERYIADPQRFADVDAALLVGSGQRAYFEQFLPPEKIHFIPHGIDTSVFRGSGDTMAERTRQDQPGLSSQPSRGATREHNCVPGSLAKRLLFVGVWLRDFITARRVMEILGRTDPQIRLDVVTLPRFKGHFLGLDNVEMHFGLSEEELIALYQRAALLLLPLIDTTFNNSIGEAIACGLPVVTSDVGSVRDYLDEDCSVLLPRRDAEGHAEAVRALLADPARRAAMAAAARRRAETLDWSRTAPPVEAVYRALRA